MSEHSVPTSLEEQKKIKAIVIEIIHSMQRMSDEREAVKELVAAAAKEYNITKRQIQKLATTAFKRNYADICAEHQDFEFLYETIVEGKKPSDVISTEEDA